MLTCQQVAEILEETDEQKLADAVRSLVQDWKRMRGILLTVRGHINHACLAAGIEKDGEPC